jgi:hypothetical protein
MGRGSATGPGGSTRSGHYAINPETGERQFVEFNPAHPMVQELLHRAMSGDAGAVSMLQALQQETLTEENPEQAALRDMGRQTQTSQNQLGQMILGQLLGGEIPLGGFDSQISPPGRNFTPWNDTEANPFPTYTPPQPVAWDNYQVPLESIRLGSPRGGGG